MLKNNNKTLGDWGEGVAGKFLERNGFVLVEKNFHTTHGELDLIVRKKEDFYGVEVKTRMNGELANDSAITATKKQRLQKCLAKYCLVRNLNSDNVYLAGIIIAVDRVEGCAKIRWYLIY